MMEEVYTLINFSIFTSYRLLLRHLLTYYYYYYCTTTRSKLPITLQPAGIELLL
jgi:hypothetical protein